MAENELARSIARFFEILGKLGVRAHITGGLASTYYGEPRYTQDVDVVVDRVILGQRMEDFLSLLSSSYLFTDSVICRAVSEGKIFQVLDTSTGFKFDMYPREGVPGELSRSRDVELFPGFRLPIVSPVDAIVSKLLWVQQGSQKSRRDIRGMWENLDHRTREEVTLEAGRLKLGELLETIVSEEEPME